MPTNMQEHKDKQYNDNLLYQLQSIFGFLDNTARQAYDPTDLVWSYKDYDGKPTNSGIQMDAQEFVGRFFDKVEESLKDTSQKYLIEDIFKGYSASQLICPSCGFNKTTIENWTTLQVEVDGMSNMHESLRKQLRGSIISEYNCQGCKKSVDATKRTLLTKTPNVIIVHLHACSSAWRRSPTLRSTQAMNSLNFWTSTPTASKRT